MCSLATAGRVWWSKLYNQHLLLQKQKCRIPWYESWVTMFYNVFFINRVQCSYVYLKQMVVKHMEGTNNCTVAHEFNITEVYTCQWRNMKVQLKVTNPWKSHYEDSNKDNMKMQNKCSSLYLRTYRWAHCFTEHNYVWKPWEGVSSRIYCNRSSRQVLNGPPGLCDEMACFFKSFSWLQN